MRKSKNLVFFFREVKSTIKSPMIWVFFSIIFLMVFGAVSSDTFIIGSLNTAVYKNAPSVIQNYYGLISVIALLVTASLVNVVALKDTESGFSQILFSYPIKRSAYFFGKFFSGFLVSLIPLLGISAGALLGPLMPWVDPSRYGAILWDGHLYGLLLFAIPNVFLGSALAFSFAINYRTQSASFIVFVLLLALYVTSARYVDDLQTQWFIGLLDPFGLYPYTQASKYATIAELNTFVVGFQNLMLVNRLLWILISFVVIWVSYKRFSFQVLENNGRKIKGEILSENIRFKDLPKPVRKNRKSVVSHFYSFARIVIFELKSIVKNRVFLILLLVGLFNLSSYLKTFPGRYGTENFPLTYEVIENVSYAYHYFISAFLIFYSGILVWKERDFRFSELTDSTPISFVRNLSAKLLALLLVIQFMLILAIVTGVLIQFSRGYYNFEWEVYGRALLVNEFLYYFYIVILAVLLQYFLNHRYLAYFITVVLVFGMEPVMDFFGVESFMLKYGLVPKGPYSDMTRFDPWVEAMKWFQIYWGVFALILCYLIYLFHKRGVDLSFSERLKQVQKRFSGTVSMFFLLGAIFIAVSSFVFYNTQLLNPYDTEKEFDQKRIKYETEYKQYCTVRQPKWLSLDYSLELFPSQKTMFFEASGVLKNSSNELIDKIYFTFRDYRNPPEILLEGASIDLDHQEVGFRIYKLKNPLKPEETLSIKIKGEYVAKGFENSLSNKSVMENGSFIYAMDFIPRIGYQRDFELIDPNKRKRAGLGKREMLPKLDESDYDARSYHYLGKDSDWIQIRSIVSTEPGQIAVSSGKLVRQWTENGRSYFEYEQEAPSTHFTAFLSAEYQIERRKWNGIDIEVYYHHAHTYNIGSFLHAMEKSLDYFIANFGDYDHSYLRIVEFPRLAAYAQAFPGLMPFSERMGFIADLRNSNDINIVFFTTAHETAHQYWAHQIIAANMSGAEFLMESLTEYSALMVMEKEYGKDHMKKLLGYELDLYLKGRNKTNVAERPLAETEGQPYVHYFKGAITLYHLKEMIGEDKMNACLKELITQFKYCGPPYPTSLDAITIFRNHTPDSLQYLIDDMFFNITLYSNQIVDGYFTQEDDGYIVEFTTKSEKFYADSLGKENAAKLSDYIDVAVFGEGADNDKLGKVLGMQRIKIDKETNKFVFKVQERPFKVGIDPYNFLIDKNTTDNLKKLEAR